MSVLTGLDQLRAEEFSRLRGKSIGRLCNQASIDRELNHILDLAEVATRNGVFNLATIFGPQHGLFGHTQDNMIEWEGGNDGRTGVAVHSLYGEHREPTPEMLRGIDCLVVDLPDIGSRYYTFAWTMALCMRVCEAAGIPVMVLDRPNPICGEQVEGPVLEERFSSFVGEYPVPTRHGLTIGELATHLSQSHFPKLQLEVVPLAGWQRSMYFDRTDLPWAMPSPNMPTLDTAIVYPGACLLEATNLSEGRGTTRPFEIFGAPYLDSWRFTDGLNALGLNGCRFRPVPFQPTFNKHAGKLCGGSQLHVILRESFEPVLAYVGIMQEVIRQSGFQDSSQLAAEAVFSTQSPEVDLPGFAWKLPPYEYVHDRRPIDILAGNSWLATAVTELQPLADVRDRMAAESDGFDSLRKEAFLYTER